jgi:hypothetical protein
MRRFTRLTTAFSKWRYHLVYVCDDGCVSRLEERRLWKLDGRILRWAVAGSCCKSRNRRNQRIADCVTVDPLRNTGAPHCCRDGAMNSRFVQMVPRRRTEPQSLEFLHKDLFEDGLLHSNGPGASRPCGRQHDDDRDARSQTRRARRPEPGRPTVGPCCVSCGIPHVTAALA